jgi:hypothetical protein
MIDKIDQESAAHHSFECEAGTAMASIAAFSPYRHYASLWHAVNQIAHPSVMRARRHPG